MVIEPVVGVGVTGGEPHATLVGCLHLADVDQIQCVNLGETMFVYGEILSLIALQVLFQIANIRKKIGKGLNATTSFFLVGVPFRGRGGLDN